MSPLHGTARCKHPCAWAFEPAKSPQHCGICSIKALPTHPQNAFGGLIANNHIAYLELPATEVAALKHFYGQLFGWTFQDYGEDYAAFEGAGLDGGFSSDPDTRPNASLAIIETDDIAAMFTKVQAAGGTITMPTFACPGGHRFHFLDPSGNELAVFQPAP